MAREHKSSFFPMPRGDRWYILAILLFAVVSFLPWSHSIQVAGMALFGWLMAILMVVAPVVALLRLRERPRPQNRQDTTP